MMRARWLMDPPPREILRQGSLRNVLEEVDDAGFERILRPDDQQSRFPYQPFEQLRAMRQVIYRRADICPHGGTQKRIPVLVTASIQHRLHRGADAIDDRAEVPGL